ncbi:MAG: TIGR02678 family protein [Acidimicrobiia bacterium]
MPDTTLAEYLSGERSRAVRVLLRSPILDAADDPDGFRLVVRQQEWLAGYFETMCGWQLTVDSAAGFARLEKRVADPDPGRPLLRTRGARHPFDCRRYELLCRVCAELVRRPVTTVGLLAGAVAGEAALETSRHGERAALVDALRALVGWGALEVTAGDVDTFVGSEHGNAILHADTARLHRLLTSATSPSGLPDGVPFDEALARLLSEPRYGEALADPAAANEEQRLRWVRHSLGRRLLDDPVVYYDDLSETERDYAVHPSGRRWLRERVAEAGFELEERAEGLMAVDPEGLATDRSFPSPNGNAHQLALLLIDRLVSTGPDGQRRTVALSERELSREVGAIRDRFPNWAKGTRSGDGQDQLADRAVDLLVTFGLVRREDDGTVTARPALARYRAGEPVVSAPSLFEEVI